MNEISGLLTHLLAAVIENSQKATQLIRALANILESGLFADFVSSSANEEEFAGLSQFALSAENYNYLCVSSGEAVGSWGEQYFHNSVEVYVVEKGRVAVIEKDGSWSHARVFDVGRQFIVRGGLSRRVYLFPDTTVHKVWRGRLSIYPELTDFDDLDRRIVKQVEFFTSLNKKVKDLPLSTRVLKRLPAMGIVYLGQLIQTPERQIREAEGLGRKSVQEIKDYLGEMGFCLGMRIEDWLPPSS